MFGPHIYIFLFSEQEAKIEEDAKKKPRSYEQSDKSSKSVASMIKVSKHETGRQVDK